MKRTILHFCVEFIDPQKHKDGYHKKKQKTAFGISIRGLTAATITSGNEETPLGGFEGWESEDCPRKQGK